MVMVCTSPLPVQYCMGLYLAISFDAFWCKITMIAVINSNKLIKSLASNVQVLSELTLLGLARAADKAHELLQHPYPSR